MLTCAWTKRRLACHRHGVPRFLGDLTCFDKTAAGAGVSEHQRRGRSGAKMPASAGWRRHRNLPEDTLNVAQKPQSALDHRRAAGLERCGRPQRSPRGRALRAGLIGAVVLIGLAGFPGTVAAGLAPPQRSGDQLEARRLAEVRERLERRRALQRSLQVQVDGLAKEIEELRVRLEKTSAMLESKRQEALVLERRLDRLVPRFLARMAEVRERRAQAVRALADLASKSRSLRLDPRLRARLLALSPLMLKRLRHVEAGLGSLRQRRDQTIERHAQIERRLPGLASARQRLRWLRVENLRLRQAALDRLGGLHLEVKLLGKEQARLARHFLRNEAASVARAEPQADQRALPSLSATRTAPVPSAVPFPSASVDKGAVDPTARLTRVADAWDRTGSRVVAEAPKPGAGLDSAELAAAVAGPTRPSSRAKPAQAALRGESPPVGPSGSHDAIGRATPLDVVFMRDGGLPERRGARTRGQQGAAPILPVPEAVQARGAIAQGRPELTIAAAPGQAVAAPVDGKVVFASTFKSYGLLLILEHEREYHTLLWGFARLDVERGEQVQVGQIVGIMDARGDDPPVLHVERRRNGRPIDLAASSNGIQG